VLSTRWLTDEVGSSQSAQPLSGALAVFLVALGALLSHARHVKTRYETPNPSFIGSWQLVAQQSVTSNMRQHTYKSRNTHLDGI
jgi:hypothetical protein